MTILFIFNFLLSAYDIQIDTLTIKHEGKTKVYELKNNGTEIHTSYGTEYRGEIVKVTSNEIEVLRCTYKPQRGFFGEEKLKFESKDSTPKCDTIHINKANVTKICIYHPDKSYKKRAALGKKFTIPIIVLGTIMAVSYFTPIPSVFLTPVKISGITMSAVGLILLLGDFSSHERIKIYKSDEINGG